MREREDRRKGWVMRLEIEELRAKARSEGKRGMEREKVSVRVDAIVLSECVNVMRVCASVIVNSAAVRCESEKRSDENGGKKREKEEETEPSR